MYNTLCATMFPGVRPVSLIIALVAILVSVGSGLIWLSVVNGFLVFRYGWTVADWGRAGWGVPVGSAVVVLVTTVVSFFLVVKGWGA